MTPDLLGFCSRRAEMPIPRDVMETFLRVNRIFGLLKESSLFCPMWPSEESVLPFAGLVGFGCF